MAHADFVEFMGRVIEDDSLRERVEALDAHSDQELIDQLIGVASAAGFSFTEDEIDELFLAHVAGEAGGKLSLDKLEQVSGGTVASGQLSPTSELQVASQSFTLQYSDLQQKMQADNRQFTLLSNIMKTKHDTAKNAINNVR